MSATFNIGPATLNQSVDQWGGIWKKCRDVLAGEEAVKNAGQEYLPKMPRMTEAEYESYKLRALFYGASHRTLQGLMGSLLRKPPVIYAPSDAIQEQLKSLTSNITQTGVNLQSFTRDIVAEILAVGRVGVLVDAPPARGLGATVPYARMYTAEEILNWRQRFIDGIPVLEQVCLMEVINMPGEGGFGTEQAVQYRELILEDGVYHQRVWVIDPPATEKDPPTARVIDEITPIHLGKPMTRIPFFFCSASHNRPEIETPPLLAMFNTNLSHYRSSADLEHGRHYTAMPTPVVMGVDTEADGVPVSLEIGSSTAWILPREANAKMLEFNGKGLVHLENALAEKATLMTQLGARMLEPSARSSETAEALRLRQAGDFATLGTISDGVGAMLTDVIRLMAWWSDIARKANDETIFVQLTKDYFESRLSPAMLTALVGAWQAGTMGFYDLYENLVRGEIIDANRDFEDVRSEVEADLKLRAQLAAALAPPVASGTQHTPRVGQGTNKPTTPSDGST